MYPVLRKGTLARRRPRIQPVQVQFVSRERGPADLSRHPRVAGAAGARRERREAGAVSAGAVLSVTRRCDREHAGYRQQSLRSAAAKPQRARALRLQPARAARSVHSTRGPGADATNVRESGRATIASPSSRTCGLTPSTSALATSRRGRPTPVDEPLGPGVVARSLLAVARRAAVSAETIRYTEAWRAKCRMAPSRSACSARAARKPC